MKEQQWRQFMRERRIGLGRQSIPTSNAARSRDGSRKAVILMIDLCNAWLMMMIYNMSTCWTRSLIEHEGNRLIGSENSIGFIQ
jgi:hypothetical protein